MEKLKDIIVRRKLDVFEYRLIKRNEHVAMYAQWYTDADEPRLISYEVFIIRKQKESVRVIGGTKVRFARKELYPGDEAFGYSAWSIVKVELAEKKFEELTRQVYEVQILLN